MLMRLVDQVAVAGVLAAMIADAATDAGEGIVFLDDAQRVVVAALADEGDVALGALAGRAGIAAGGDALLFDGVGVGDGLRVELVRGALRRPDPSSKRPGMMTGQTWAHSPQPVHLLTSM